MLPLLELLTKSQYRAWIEETLNHNSRCDPDGAHNYVTGISVRGIGSDLSHFCVEMKVAPAGEDQDDLDLETVGMHISRSEWLALRAFVDAEMDRLERELQSAEPPDTTVRT
jgi:hypothetical protein